MLTIAAVLVALVLGYGFGVLCERGRLWQVLREENDQ
jgi:hypothetical protein